MNVASFYAPRPDHPRHVHDYLECLRLQRDSCARFRCGHVVITDAASLGDLRTFRAELPHDLMPAILDGQRQFLAATPGPVLLVGADCLLTRDPREVLAGDMVITIGPFSDCEMNTGAIWCADGPTCAPVWQQALERKPTGWGDDQTSLYEAVKASGLDARRVRAETHNWAPNDAHDPAGMPTVAHFRGKRKAWMAEWAERFGGLA